MFCFVMSIHCNWKTSFIKACSVNGTIVEPFIFRAANGEVFAFHVVFKPYNINGKIFIIQVTER